MAGPAVSKDSGLSAWRILIPGLACLALFFAYFAARGVDLTPLGRLRQTRLDLTLHILCAALFLCCMWRRQRQGLSIFPRPSAIVPLGFLVYLWLSAGKAPIRGAALEQWAHWLDAAFLLFVGFWSLAEAAPFFLLLLTCMGALVGAAGVWNDTEGSLSSATLYALALSLISAGLLLVLAARNRGQSLVPRIAALVLWCALVATGIWLLSPNPGPGPENFAAEAIAAARPLEGAGLGALPEVLLGFADGDYISLPLPRDGVLSLQAELGWLGLAFAGLLFISSFFAALLAIVAKPFDSDNILAIGLGGILAAAFVLVWRSPVFSHPFGQAAFFIVFGMLLGLKRSGETKPIPAARPLLRSSTIVVLLVTAGSLWAAVREIPPWRAARLAIRKADETHASEPYGARLARAVRIYPHEPGHWDALAVHWRETLGSSGLATAEDEALFQSFIGAYQKAIDANPYRFRYHGSMALKLYDAKRMPEMIDSLRKGLEFLPHSQTLRRWLVKGLLESQNYSASLNEMKNLEREIPSRLRSKNSGQPGPLNPEWILIHFRQAEIYEMLGDRPRAYDQYALAFEKDTSGMFRDKSKAAMERLAAAGSQKSSGEGQDQ
jgi:hypothetical protein